MICYRTVNVSAAVARRHSLRLTNYRLGDGCRYASGTLAHSIENMPCKLENPLLHIELHPRRPCIYLGITRIRNFCKFCRTFKPVPGTSESSVRQCHKYPRYGYSIVIPARNCWKFWKTFTPVPGTYGSSVRLSYPDPEFLLVLYDPCHNTRGTSTACFVPARVLCEFCTPVPQYPNFCEFCNTSIPVLENSVSSVSLPHPYPESTNPT